MTTLTLPQLDASNEKDTREALHAYAKVLGSLLKSCRPKRKHWWHASLRPSVSGLTTGVVHAGVDFELELNLRQSILRGQTSHGAELTLILQGQPAGEVATRVKEFLLSNGLNQGLVPAASGGDADTVFDAYSAEQANKVAIALNSVSTAMTEFRAGIREETSPIQLWPHHFDLSMIWLPGQKIPGQDPLDEEYSDKQMNFGFAFGDSAIPEAYFYVTAYPFDKSFLRLPLAATANWQTLPFNAAVLRYAALRNSDDPSGDLQALWSGLLSAGREQFLDKVS